VVTRGCIVLMCHSSADCGSGWEYHSGGIVHGFWLWWVGFCVAAGAKAILTTLVLLSLHDLPDDLQSPAKYLTPY
jgi:hypothetical protein